MNRGGEGHEAGLTLIGFHPTENYPLDTLERGC
jgi:hypothetical protein